MKSALMLALWLVSATTLSTELATQPFDLEQFLKDNPAVRSVEGFVEALAPHKLNGFLLTESESLQLAAPDSLRVVRTAGATAFAWSTVRDRGGKLASPTVEISSWVPEEKRWRKMSATFRDGRVETNLDDKTCNRCHGPDPRPNFDAYDSWPHVLGFNRDRIYRGSAEETALLRIVETRFDDPLLKGFPFPEALSVRKLEKAEGKKRFEATIDWKHKTVVVEGPGKTTFNKQAIPQGGPYVLMGRGLTDEGGATSFFTAASDANGARIQRQLRKPDVAADEFALVLAAQQAGCFAARPETLENFFPPALWKRHLEFVAAKSYAKFEEKMLEDRRTHASDKAQLTVLGLEKLIVANDAYELRPKAPAKELHNRAIAELRRRNEVEDAFPLDTTKRLVDREQYENHPSLALARFLFGPYGTQPEWWSMGARQRSQNFAFGDSRSSGGVLAAFQSFAAAEKPPEPKLDTAKKPLKTFLAWCDGLEKRSVLALEKRKLPPLPVRK